MESESPCTAGVCPHVVTDARMQLAAVFVEIPIHTPAVRDSEAGQFEAFLLAQVNIGEFRVTMIARLDLDANGEQRRAQAQD